jgi:hypothetical protein
LQLETNKGINIYFYVTHAPEELRHPYMEIIGEKGKITWNMQDENTVLELNNEPVIKFDNKGIDPYKEEFRVLAKKQFGEIKDLYCTPENTRNFVVAINGAYDSAQKIKAVPQNLVEEFSNEDGEYQTVLTGIDKLMDRAFRERKLLSDLNIDWAVKTDWFNVENYTAFNPFS